MADRLDIPQEEADEFIRRYLAGFPAVARFISETIEQGTEHGYVSTLFGRRRQIPELRARRWELRKQGERFAVNMVIQGTAADIMKVAMVRCDHALKEAGLSSRMILQIHDELLFEGPPDEAEAVKELAIREMGGAFDTGYVALIKRFMLDVAADSHLPTNVYGLSGQYRDRSGAAAYKSHFAGAVIAT